MKNRDIETLIDVALDEVRGELFRAIENFPPFRSAHEGVAIVDEEMREFRNAAYWPHRRGAGDEEEEVMQLAAMAVRYLVDVCYKEDVPR